MIILCETERLYLRNVELSDTKLIVNWKNDPLTREMSVGSNAEITFETQEADVKRALEYGQCYLIIVVKETEEPIGYIRIDWLDEEAKFAWLRFGLGTERDKGYCKEALKALIYILFENGLHRIDAEVYEFNKVSFNLLKSIGWMLKKTCETLSQNKRNKVC